MQRIVGSHRLLYMQATEVSRRHGPTVPADPVCSETMRGVDVASPRSAECDGEQCEAARHSSRAYVREFGGGIDRPTGSGPAVTCLLYIPIQLPYWKSIYSHFIWRELGWNMWVKQSITGKKRSGVVKLQEQAHLSSIVLVHRGKGIDWDVLWQCDYISMSVSLAKISMTATKEHMARNTKTQPITISTPYLLQEQSDKWLHNNTRNVVANSADLSYSN